MYKQILVAIDGSNPSSYALIKSSKTSQRANAQLTIGHVIDTRNLSWSTFDESSIWTKLKQEAEQLIKEHIQRAKKLGVEHVDSALVSGNPRIEISQNLPEQFNADLLVVGSSGRNAVERMIIGSVTDAAVRHAPCDVLTVKSDSHDPIYKRILVAVDGSEQAEAALDKAIYLAKIFNAKLIIAHIYEQPSDIFTTDSERAQNQLIKQEEMLERYRRQSLNNGVKEVSSVLNRGNPRDHIPNILAVQNDIDLLVTGATGRGAIERLFTGSVALAALYRAPCDILTVKV